MSLKQQFEKYNIITDEDIARGVVYAWTLMTVADQRVERVELDTIQRFANSYKMTRRFHEGDWLENTVGEALNVYNTEGKESLLSIIAEQLKNASLGIKRLLLFSMIQLACCDEDFSERELELLDHVVDLLKLHRKDVLMIGMLYATAREDSL